MLVAARLPSLAQPAGGDQGLYVYTAQRIVAGDVMYRDVWDQKPPGIAFLYALPSFAWPHDSLVPAADLAAACGVAALLVVLGRRRYSAHIGYGAAALFLLLGDPYLQRLSGVYVRGQCEPFMSVAVTAGLVLLAGGRPARRAALLGAGAALAAAFWLKYNAAAYGVALAAAAWAWRPASDQPLRGLVHDLAWIGAAFAGVGAVVLGYFAFNGALVDLRLATIDYNLAYSNETYDSPIGVPAYLLRMPFERARVDMLWFVGGLGALLLAARRPRDGSTHVAVVWLAAAILSIAINGSRGLPNYFVQAAPALALAGSAGLATLAGSRAWIRVGTAAIIVLGLWRVGADTPVAGLRLGGMPGLLDNLRFDLAYLRGNIDRDTYLDRFQGVKFDALEIDRLASLVRTTTDPGAPVLVFGFSGGSVGWRADRPSPTRFFWSRPVIIDFAAGRAGYGWSGLAEDLLRRPPALVALQKDEWRSRDHFLAQPTLRRWLEAAYAREHDSAMFEVWRRRP
jgi:hypothetical protein